MDPHSMPALSVQTIYHTQYILVQKPQHLELCIPHDSELHVNVYPGKIWYAKKVTWKGQLGDSVLKMANCLKDTS